MNSIQAEHALMLVRLAILLYFFDSLFLLNKTHSV